MHTRRAQRMVLVRFGPGFMNDVPGELQLNLREVTQDAWLFEHRGTLDTLLAWMSTQDVEEIAIGTEDLHSLYNQYHGADAVDAAGKAS
jgi:ABC-2 type transport system ATP-binding protein